MIQEIITYLIIAAAITYTGFSLFRKLENKNSKTCSNCSGCSCK